MSWQDVEDLRRDVRRIEAMHRSLAEQVAELHRLISRVTARGASE